MKNLKLSVFLLIFAVLSGCVTTEDVMNIDAVQEIHDSWHVVNVKEKEDIFHGSRVIYTDAKAQLVPKARVESSQLPPERVGTGNPFNVVNVGYIWNSAHEEYVTLSFLTSGITGFYGILVRIGDDQFSFDAGDTYFKHKHYNEVLGYIDGNTSNSLVSIPFSFFERMVMEDEVFIRVRTTDGYMDSQFSLDEYTYDNLGTYKAARFHAKRFLQKVAESRQTVS